MTGEKGKEEITCTYQRWYERPCGKTLYDSKHCIFHSEDIEGKKEKFNDAFWKEFERQKEHEKEYDFEGFVFPRDISFEWLEFEKGVYFSKAQFSGKANFLGAQFSGFAAFSEARFSAESNFRITKFSATADFARSQFSGEALFWEAQFSGEALFFEIQFSGAGDFRHAQFSGKGNFRSSRFSGRANFVCAQFSGKAYFEGAQFSWEALIWEAQFSGDAYFGEVKVSGKADFRKTQFFGKADFGGAQFSRKADFSETQFSGKADFMNAEFHGKSFFKDVKFEDLNQCNMTDTSFYNVFDLLEYITKNRNKFKHPKGIKYLHDDCKPILGEPTVSRLPLLSREIRDDIYLMSFKDKHPWLFKIWWLFADCGRSILRWALWAILFAVLFAFIYHNVFFLNDPTTFYQTNINIHETWPGFSFLYYSIVTFTTLGFGDIVPEPGWPQFCVTIEVILGYIMLGGLISILANKLARRS